MLLNLQLPVVYVMLDNSHNARCKGHALFYVYYVLFVENVLV